MKHWTNEHEIGRLTEQRDQLGAENARLREALEQCAASFILKSPAEDSINYERLAREFNRRQKLARDVLT